MSYGSKPVSPKGATKSSIIRPNKNCAKHQTKKFLRTSKWEAVLFASASDGFARTILITLGIRNWAANAVQECPASAMPPRNRIPAVS
jgi:hypothetical protein